MADGLSASDRARVLKELDAVAYDLNSTAVVLEQAGAGAASAMVERAAVERPSRNNGTVSGATWSFCRSQV